jgi:hypothetical protein
VTDPFRDELAAAHERIAELESFQTATDAHSERETRAAVARIAATLDEAAQRYHAESRWFSRWASAASLLFLVTIGVRGGVDAALGTGMILPALCLGAYVLAHTVVFRPQFVRKCRALSDSLRDIAGDRAGPKVRIGPYENARKEDSSIAPARRPHIASPDPPPLTDREDSPSEDRARRGT